MNTFLPKSLRARLVIGAAIWISVGVYAAGIFIAELFRQYATSLVDSDLRRDLEELTMLIDTQVRVWKIHFLHHFCKSLNTPVVFPTLVDFRDDDQRSARF